MRKSVCARERAHARARVQARAQMLRPHTAAGIIIGSFHIE